MFLCRGRPAGSRPRARPLLSSAPGVSTDTIECDKCAEDMEIRVGPFGKYFKCLNPECTNTRKLLRDGTAAPPKKPPIPMPELRCEKHTDDTYVLRNGGAGVSQAVGVLDPVSRLLLIPGVPIFDEDRGVALFPPH